jgi:hypothetical protein
MGDCGSGQHLVLTACVATRTANNKRIRKRKTHRKGNYPIHRPRSKPHPKDHQFPVRADAVLLPEGGTPTINRLSGRTTPTKMVVFALAMSWDNARDRIRLQMMQLCLPGTNAVTVSRCRYTKGNLPHAFCADFSISRGWPTIANRIREEKVASPGARIVVVLDYYWCALRYYQRVYGMLWLHSGAHHFLQNNGADEVLLPFDSIRNHEDGSGMVSMLAGTVHPQVKIEFVPGHANPLWVASNHADIADALAGIPGGDNSEQCRQWLHETTPFVRCTLH